MCRIFANNKNMSSWQPNQQRSGSDSLQTLLLRLARISRFDRSLTFDGSKTVRKQERTDCNIGKVVSSVTTAGFVIRELMAWKFAKADNLGMVKDGKIVTIQIYDSFEETFSKMLNRTARLSLSVIEDGSEG